MAADKRSTKTNTTCGSCGKEFRVKSYFLRIGLGKYCSRPCHYVAMRTATLAQCFVCEKKIERTPSRKKKTKSGKFFCSKSCQTKWRNAVYVGPRHLNWKDGRGVDYREIMLKQKKLELCSHCGTGDTRVLAVHHKDNNHLNNDPANLMWLCHNCHQREHIVNKKRPRPIVGKML